MTFLAKVNFEANSPVREVADFLGALNYYALESISGEPPSFVSEQMLAAWQADPVDFSSPTVCLLKLVDLWLNDRSTFDEVEEILGPNRLNLIENISIDARSRSKDKLPSSGQGKDYMTFFETASGYSYYEDLSFGTKRILQIIVAMLYKPSSVLLFEQPEDGIHPGLLSRLIGVLQSYTNPMQLILTSHSPSVINAIGASDIRLVQAPGGSTQVHALSVDEIAKAKRYVDETGQLADYIRLLES